MYPEAKRAIQKQKTALTCCQGIKIHVFQNYLFDSNRYNLPRQSLAVSYEKESSVFVVSLTYKVELSEVDQHINDHIAYLDKYYEKGNFIASGRKVPRTGGVILAHAESREKMNAILQEDPFFKADVARYEITEFVPSKVGQSFGALEKLI